MNHVSCPKSDPERQIEYGGCYIPGHKHREPILFDLDQLKKERYGIPPFTAHEFLDQFMRLLHDTSGAITHEDFEKFSGAKMDERKAILGYDKIYSSQRGVQWYFWVDIFEKNSYESHWFFKHKDNKNSFELYLGAPNSFGYDWRKTCLRASDFSQALRNAGWSLKSSNKLLGFDDYSLKNKSVNFIHGAAFIDEPDGSDTCVDRITVQPAMVDAVSH